jgi:hypothetical protein
VRRSDDGSEPNHFYRIVFEWFLGYGMCMTYLDGPRATQKALRQAQLYGYLIARHGRLYHPGGNRPLCSVQLSKQIVRSGWLRFGSGKYELTPEGLRRVADFAA